MTYVGQNFELYAGNYKDIIVPITGSDGGAYNMTGASVTWIMRELDNVASLIRKHGEGSSAASGLSYSTSTLTISLSPNDTILYSGTYYHSACGKDSASRVATLFEGTIRIK